MMTPELVSTVSERLTLTINVRFVCDHAQGNLRALMNIASELLAYAAEREARQIDEKLFLETCAPPAAEPRQTAGRRR